MKKLFASAFLCLLSLLSVAQTPSIEWGIRGGGSGSSGNGPLYEDDIATDVETDRYGNVIICGEIYHSNNANIHGVPVVTKTNVWGDKNQNAFVASFDCDGNLNWQVTIPSDERTRANGLTVDTLGNVYVCGSGSSGVTGVTFGDSVYLLGSQSYVAKIDTNGEFVWVHVSSMHKAPVGGWANAGSAALKHIEIDEDQNIYTYGMSRLKDEYAPSISLDTGYFLAKYNTDGQVIWAKNFTGAKTPYALGLNGMDVSSNGEILIVGTIEDTVYISGQQFINTSYGDMIVLKFDSVGNYKWGYVSHYNANPPGLAGATGGDVAYDPSDENVFYLVGAITPNVSIGSIGFPNNPRLGSSGYIVKFIGNVPVWGKSIHASAGTGVAGVDVDAHGRVYTAPVVLGTGSFAGMPYTTMGVKDPMIAIFDKQGNADTAFTISGDGARFDTPYAIKAAYNGNVYVVGTFGEKLYLPNTTLEKVPFGNTDFFLVKYGIENCEDTTIYRKDITGGILSHQVLGSISIYPNPNNGRFVVESDSREALQLLVYSSLGQLVHSQQIIPFGRNEITLPQNLKDGMYLVHYQGKDINGSSKLILRSSRAK